MLSIESCTKDIIYSGKSKMSAGGICINLMLQLHHQEDTRVT